MFLWPLVFSGLALGSPPDDAVGMGYRAKRPTLSGDELTFGEEGGRFLVHYTLSGEDTPGGPDSDGDGAPDMVESVLNILNEAAEYFETQRGYIPVNRDQGVGGSTAIDLYIKTIDANGYATSVKGEPGTSCFMRLAPFLGAQPEDVLVGVTAHELHHCVQYAYATGVASWVNEGTSTYEQYRFAPGMTNDYALGFLYYERLQGAGRALDETDGRFEYASFLFMKFWDDFSGATGALPALWESLREYGSWKNAFDAASQSAFALDLEQSFLEYATWNAFACAREDGQHYDLNALPCIIDVSVPIKEVQAGEFTITHEDSPYTTTYYRHGEPGLAEVTCETTQGIGQLRLVGVSAGGKERGRRDGLLEADDSVKLRTFLPVSDGGETLILATSLGEEPLEATCKLEVVASFEEDARGRGCAVVGGVGGPGWWVSLMLIFWRARWLWERHPVEVVAARRGELR